jgi:hypothetical protein
MSAEQKYENRSEMCNHGIFKLYEGKMLYVEHSELLFDALELQFQHCILHNK